MKRPMITKCLLPVLCVALALATSACSTGSIPFQPTNTATPTNAPLPTFTARPTATAKPTETPTVAPTETATPVNSEVVSVLKENGFVRSSVDDCGSACTTYQNSSAEMRAAVYENGTVTYSNNITNPKVQGDLMEKLIIRLYGEKVDVLVMQLSALSYTRKKPQSITVDGYKLSAEVTHPHGTTPATISIEVTPIR